MSRRGLLSALTAAVATAGAVLAGIAPARAKLALNLPPGARKCPNNECSYIYDPAVGDAGAGIPPGTAFEDLPDDWVCPECGTPKAVW